MFGQAFHAQYCQVVFSRLRGSVGSKHPHSIANFVDYNGGMETKYPGKHFSL